MAPVVEAVPEMDATIPVLFVICLQRREHAQFYSGGVSVLLDGSDDFDCDELVAFPVTGLHHLAEGPLSEKSHYLILAC